MVFNFGWAPQLFGAKRDGGRRRHAGIDLGTAGRRGVPVGCPISGFVVQSVSYRRGYGHTVDLISEDGTKMMRFAHLAEQPRHLTPGSKIQQGDWLGDVGNSGGNYAIHLHFEYRTLQNGRFVPVNPFQNPYHSFSQEDFEHSTRLAQQSRSLIKGGSNLSEAQIQTASTGSYESRRFSSILANKGFIHGSLLNRFLPKQAEPATLQEGMNYWQLERTFESPSWWERHMPQALGGWSKKRIEEADIQKLLDEEVFKGIRRKEMLQAGLSNQDIDLLRQYVDDEIKMKGLNRFLGASSIPINFEEVFEDPAKVALARTYFNNKANTTQETNINTNISTLAVFKENSSGRV